mmetsp:Transcript_33650/g.51925  ORF Transcript_33650/g.51925 Transcript_33650/m.51925 type:complete len:104 (-) Transcript_33650:1805-2116(-)
MNWALNIGNAEADPQIRDEAKIEEFDRQQEEAKKAFSSTLLSIFNRYVKYKPVARNDLINYLLEVDRLDDVLVAYEDICDLNEDHFFFKQSAKSKDGYSMEMC